MSETKCSCGHSSHSHTGITKDEQSGPCVLQGCECKDFEEKEIKEAEKELV